MVISKDTRKAGRRYIKCTECNRKWNVSAVEPIDKNTYICPQCRTLYKKRRT